MKKYLLGLFILLTSIILVACDNKVELPETFYELNSEVLPEVVEEYTITSTVDDINYQYSRVENKEGYHTKLAKGGLVTNFDPVKSVSHIKVIFEKDNSNDSLLLYYGDHILPVYNERRVTSNMTIRLKDESTHFLLQSPTGGINIEKIFVYYSETNIADIKKDLLPEIHINRIEDENGIIQEIKDKENYVKSDFWLIDHQNPENNLGSAEEPLLNEIRLRGNSTRTKPKRPYKIKLDKKTSLFGLGEEKAWALLADYMDGSRLHNFSAFELAKHYDNLGFHATGTHVKLYLDGDYKGVYFITEHQEAREVNRVPVKFKFDLDTPFEDFNFMIELDRSAKFYNDVDNPSPEIEGIHYFNLPDKTGDKEEGYYISIKYPKMKEFTGIKGVDQAEAEARYFEFFDYIKDYTQEIIDLFDGNDTALLESKVDFASLTDYMLLDTIMLETDHQSQSFKMHYKKEDDKLFFGPIWDYDLTVMGLKSDTKDSPYPFPYDNMWTKGAYTEKRQFNPFFKKYVAKHGGQDALVQRYQEVGSESIKDLLSYLQDYYLPYIIEDLIDDMEIWHERDIAMLFANIEYMMNYFEQRMDFLDKHLR